MRRTGGDRSYLFVLNHTGEETAVPFARTDLLKGTTHADGLRIPAGGVAVLREGRQLG